MRKIRIILIDDHIMTLQSLGKWLSIGGYEVIPFSEPILCPYNEKITYKCIKANECTDIFLTDFEMPKINGLELLQKQSEISCKLDIKNKAVISGAVDEEIKLQIRKLGYKFFSKPIELSELSDWLKECEKRIDLSEPLSRVEG
jgi:DNA-binding NtrC family response regulator